MDTKLIKLFEDYKQTYEKVCLDLACGTNKRSPNYIGIDLVETKDTDYLMDLQKYPWNIDSESVDEIYCSHYVEHIPHDIKNLNDQRDGFFQFFDEIYRILKPKGKVIVICPYYTSVRAFQDPTHCRFITQNTFGYINKEWRVYAHVDQYDVKCDFDVTYSFSISNEMTLKSEEVRKKAFENDWNVIDDLIVDLTKR
jgi:predicted SAM-dependent methyltransferase